MDLSSLNSIYAFYNPYGLYGLSGSSLLSSLTGVNRAQESSNVGAVGSVGSVSAPSSQTNVSSLGKTLSAIGNLQSAASKLAQPGAFSALATTTSAANVASGNAANGTAQGAYTVKVDQLAQAQQLKSSAQSSQYDTIGSGADTTVNFQFANGRSASVNLTGSDNTLKGLAEAINRSDIGVSAKVVSGSEGYQLQLTGQTGAANAFTVSATGDATLSGFFSSPPGGNGLLLSQQAQDAQGSVNGTAFNASTNNVSTSVEGLSLKLSGTGTTTVSVGTNANQTKAVTDFVTAYNAVQTGVSSLAREYPGFSLSAPFLRSGLSNALNPGAGAGGNGVNSLKDLGITTNANGTLSVNEDTLRNTLTSNPDAVASIFSTSSSTGVADRVLAQVNEGGSLSVDNLLKTAAPSLASPSITSAKLQNSLVTSLLSQQQDLLSQYSRLGSFTSSLNSTSNLLSSLLNNSTGLNGLGLVGGLSNPSLTTSLFSSS